MCNFSISTFTVATLDGWMGRCFWRMGATSGHVSMWCSIMDGSKLGISVYDLAKMSHNSWKRAVYASTSSREEDAPNMISSIILELVEMSILIVGEMFAMFPSLKASGDRIGFLNQSNFPWMKSLVSTKNWSDCDTSSYGRKNERWCMSSHGYSGVVRGSSIFALLLKQ